MSMVYTSYAQFAVAELAFLPIPKYHLHGPEEMQVEEAISSPQFMYSEASEHLL
jgi:hypothetical protein